MKIDFTYNKKNIKYIHGYIIKGKFYRCNYIRFRTLYDKPALGTETVQVFNFQPKAKKRASVLILHGLGSRNIKFFLWMGTHLASAGVNSTILILPGNYTRVENNSVSGRSYIWPDIKIMFKFWEHAIVDIQSTLDLLEQQNLWSKNNCLIGYCLGGMLSSIVASFDKRIDETIFMTTGGHIPKILYQSKSTKFARKLFENGYKSDYYLHDKYKLFETYTKQFPIVKKMPLRELLISDEIHPLFKIDPISYAHLLDKSKITFIDALFDETLPIESRSILYNQMAGAKRYSLPITHTGWLLFEYFFAQYVLLKLNIKDKASRKMLLKKDRLEISYYDYFSDYFSDYIFKNK